MFDELLEYPFGRKLAVMFPQLGVEFRLHGGKKFEAIAQVALRVVAHGVRQAKPVAIIGVALDPGLVDPVNNLPKGEGIAGGKLGVKEFTLVLVDNGVAQESGLGPARTEADHIPKGGF